MKTKKSGFTLLELLIAVVLVAVLTMLATQTFRKTAADIRVENVKRGADAIAAAAHRFSTAYPDESVGNGALAHPSAAEDCSAVTPNPVQKLVNCGFLDNRHYWDSSDFSLTMASGVVTVLAVSPQIQRYYDPNNNYRVYTTSNYGFVQTGY